MIPNGTITYSPDSTSIFSFSTTATYSCNQGFYPSHTSVRTCTGSGATSFWGGEEPECVGRFKVYIRVAIYSFTPTAIVCTSLITPANGLVSYDPDTSPPYDYQTVATYSCNPGYGLFGGDRTRQCLNSSSGEGEWKGMVPICEGELLLKVDNCNL